MESRSPLTAAQPRRRRKPAAAVAPQTQPKGGIASLAAWLNAFQGASGDRREAWKARREARELSRSAMSRALAASAEVLAVMPTGQAPLYAAVPVNPPAPPVAAARLEPRRRRADAVAFDDAPPAPMVADLLALVEAALPVDGDVEVPAWVRAEAPLDPSGTEEGAELFKLFRANVDGLADLARLDAEPARPWWHL